MVDGTIPEGLGLEAYNDASAYSPNAPYYITAAWDAQTVYGAGVPNVITVGNGAVYRVGGMAYANVPLRNGRPYTIFTRYDIENDGDLAQVSGSRGAEAQDEMISF